MKRNAVIDTISRRGTSPCVRQIFLFGKSPFGKENPGVKKHPDFFSIKAGE